MSKNLVRFVCALLAVLMVVSVVAPILFTAFAEDTQETNEQEVVATSSDDLQAQKDDLRQQLQDLQNALKEINNNIEQSEDDLKSQQSTKQYYEQQKNNIAAQIELLKADIVIKEEEVAQKQAELEQKVLQVADTKALFEDRLKAMYIMKNESDLSVLLGATSFSDSLRYAENLQQISINDTTLIERLRVEEAELELQSAELDVQLSDLNAVREELGVKEAEYAASIQQVNSAISQTEAELESQQLAYAENKAAYEAAQKEWNSFTQANPDLGFVYDGGTFSWPLPGYFRLSSDYGVGRWIYGVYDVHRGMDLPAPQGTTIYAAADGLVSTTAHWSYGTVVKIDHGSGLVSLYGHMSARYVNSGDYVLKGDPIGAVGSTGNSTGNHLHFEVNVNGTPVSPRNYLDASVVNKLYW